MFACSEIFKIGLIEVCESGIEMRLAQTFFIDLP